MLAYVHTRKKPRRGRHSDYLLLLIPMIFAALITVLALSSVGEGGSASIASASVESGGASKGAVLSYQPAGPGLAFAHGDSSFPDPVPAPRTRSTTYAHVGPSERYAVLGTLPAGSEVQVLGRNESGTWLAIAFPAGSSLTAWIPLVSLDNPPDIAALNLVPVRLLP